MIVFVKDSPRGYTRDMREKKRARPPWRRRRYCSLCTHPLPLDRVGRLCCECVARDGPEGLASEDQPLRFCICVFDESAPYRPQSVCGFPCPVHAPAGSKRPPASASPPFGFGKVG